MTGNDAQNDREVELVNGVPCHPERIIVILNGVKDLECRSGLCTRFFADAQNDREDVQDRMTEKDARNDVG